jgi:hypothetical protein
VPAAGKIRASLKALEADEAQVRKTLTSPDHRHAAARIS